MRRLLLLALTIACAPRHVSADTVPSLPEAPMATTLHTPLSTRVQGWRAEGQPATLDEDRLPAFEMLADWIRERAEAGKPADLLFVCTHNSRRSHMGQLWAAAAAAQTGLAHVRTWSGGTEATAFNPRSVTALRAHGFDIQETGEVLGDKNVVYATRIGDGAEPIRGFSKTYGDAFNPQQEFAAIMVCSEADGACPFVPGADLRVSIPYLDPKARDGQPDEEATYLAKSEEIGREMAWLMQLATP